jgi:hypothetical protein
MSDIRKLLDTINEMATTSGSVASVASPMGGVKSRKKDSIFYEGSTCKSCGCDPCKCDTSADNTIDGTKTPDAPKVSEFGLWKNSALIGQEQREKKKKKSVAETKSRSPYLGDREYNALDDVQDKIAKMAHRHKDDEWSLEDSEKLGKRLASRGRNNTEKLDELGNSLMPGGQRKLRLAQEDGNPNRFDPRASRRHPGAVDETIADTARDAVKGVKRFMKSKPTVRHAIINHDSKAQGAESKRDVFNVTGDTYMSRVMGQYADREHEKAERIKNKFAAESTTKRTKK